MSAAAGAAIRTTAAASASRRPVLVDIVFALLPCGTIAIGRTARPGIEIGKRAPGLLAVRNLYRISDCNLNRK